MPNCGTRWTAHIDPITKHLHFSCSVSNRLYFGTTSGQQLITKCAHWKQIVLQLTESPLLSEQGSQLSTLYEWKFGDNHTLEKTGLANANSTSHNYSIPNTYVVVVTATNDAGKSVAYKQITVLGR